MKDSQHPPGINRHKVVIILKGYPRLSETFIAQEILGLEKAGIDIAIVSLRHPTDHTHHAVHDEIQAAVNYLPEYLHEEPLRVLRGLFASLRRPGFIRALRHFLRDLIRDKTRNRIRRFGQAAVLVNEWPDGGQWLHAHFIHTPASVAAYASTISGIPWTVSAHAKDIWTSPDWELREKLAQANWTVTCTGVGHHHLQSLAQDASRVHLSYHGLDLQRFPAFSRPVSLRDGRNADDPVLILSVGRAVEKKGYDILLQALALLPSTLHWRFLHIGGGTELARLQSLAEALKLDGKITWLGAMSQEEVLTNYRAADVFTLASKVTDDGDRDGLPNVLVEAASQGLSCVATGISGIPELFNEDNSLLVAPEDPSALAAALMRAIESPVLRSQLGQAAEEKVRSRLDYRHSIEQLVELFETEWTAVL